METDGQITTIRREATVVETPPPEKRTRAEILAEVQRLGLDARHAIDPSGESDDGVLAVVNEAMLTRAVADTQSALGLQDWYKFDPLTGAPLPELKKELVKFSDGTVLEGGIDKASYRARLAAVKGLLGERVQEAQANGSKLPESDPLTGLPVTPDSLAAYDAVFNPDKWQVRQISKPVTIQSTPGLTVLQGGSVPPDSGQVTIERTQSILTTPTSKAA